MRWVKKKDFWDIFQNIPYPPSPVTTLRGQTLHCLSAQSGSVGQWNP